MERKGERKGGRKREEEGGKEGGRGSTSLDAVSREPTTLFLTKSLSRGRLWGRLGRLTEEPQGPLESVSPELGL